MNLNLNIRNGKCITRRKPDLSSILFLFPIISYYGYSYVGINLSYFKGLYLIILPLMFLYIGNLWFEKKLYLNLRYFSIMSLITLSTILSIIMGYLFWGQTIDLGYRVTAPFLAIVFYFYLLKIRPSLGTLETFIWIYTVIYILLWLYGTSQAPNIVFGDPENILEDSRGVFRLHIPGKGILVLAFFLAINKYVLTHKKQFIFFAVLLFLIIISHVIRQVILWSFLVGVYYLLRNNKNVWLYLSMIGVLLLLFSDNIQIPKDSIISNLIELTEYQVDNQTSGENDIRIREYQFFFSDYSKNIITDIFGNGMPHVQSSYGKRYVNAIQESNEYFLSDVGYAQMFVVTGLIGLCLYLLLFWRIIRQKASPVMMFAKLFIIYQLFANIAASWYTHDVILIAVCIYLLSLDQIQNKMINSFLTHSRVFEYKKQRLKLTKVELK